MTKINIPNYQLNRYITDTCPCFDGANKWQRIDIGDFETYVGDNCYVITIISSHLINLYSQEQVCNKVRETVIRYLQGEGFVSGDYIYIGLQEIDLQNPPNSI